jgi:hypothetical protein
MYVWAGLTLVRSHGLGGRGPPTTHGPPCQPHLIRAGYSASTAATATEDGGSPYWFDPGSPAVIRNTNMTIGPTRGIRPMNQNHPDFPVS